KVGRAVCNLMFLSDFTMPYNAATADSDLGIPLITEPDVTLTDFSRGSMQACYDFVIKDLTEALPDLGPVVHRRRFSKSAAEFYLTRVYLYMGRFEEAKSHIEAAFSNVENAVIPLGLHDFNDVL